MERPILAVKLKNALIREYGADAGRLEFGLKNILVNGQKRGCSGFITDKVTGNIIYVTTERPILSGLTLMYRYADSEKDYTGHRNRWSKTPDVYCLAHEVAGCLRRADLEEVRHREKALGRAMKEGA